MKQKSPTILDRVRRAFPPIPLYLPDIQQIISIAQTRGLVVEISDDLNIYEDLVDLREYNASKATALDLSFKESESALRDLTVKFTSDGVVVSANRTDVLLAFWHEVVNLLEKRTPWYAKLMKPTNWLLAVSASAFIPLKVEPDTTSATIKLAAMAIFAFMAVTSFYYIRTNSGVHLKKKHEVQGLWEKYGEKVLLMLIGAAIGLGSKWIGDTLLVK